MQKKKYGSVEGLKYILMLLVITCHYYNSLAFTDDSLPQFTGSFLLFHYSYLAVELFFLISGFFMANSIQTREENLTSFVARRIKRLYPLSIISTLILLLVGLSDSLFFHVIGLKYDAWRLFLSLTGMTVWFSKKIQIYNGPLWYVQVLLLCEILLHIVYTKRKNRTYLLACVLIVFASLGIKMLNLEVPFLNESIMRGVFNYFLGVTLFECTKRQMNWKLIASVSFAVSIAILSVGILENSVEHIGNFQLCVSFIISPAFFLACLYIEPIKKLLSMPPFVYLGKTTYSILTTHMTLIYVIRIMRHLGVNFDLSRISSYLFYLLMSTLVGIACYEFVERRFIPWALPKMISSLKVQKK